MLPLCLKISQRSAANLLLKRYNHNSQNISESAASSFRKFVLSRYIRFVKNYENVLEKRFPAALRVLRVFQIGAKEFYQDIKGLIRIYKKLNASDFNQEVLTRKELEIYYKTPKDMLKVTPVLLISSLPFANYVVFPIAYAYPHHFLSSHFWSLQQKTQFAVADLKKSLTHFKPVFRCLQAQVDSLVDNRLYKEWIVCIAMLGSGLHPSVDQVIQSAPLFNDKPYHLKYLTSKHLRSLLKLHNMHTWWFKRYRLKQRAMMIYAMDRAIIKEGGILNLTNDEIRQACFLRGLNPTNTNSEETRIWFSDWLALTQNTYSESLILHAPILLAYNHPSNWILRY